MKLLVHGIGTYRDGIKFGPAVWPHHDLLVLREGAAEFRTPYGLIDLRAGDALWIPPKVKFWGTGEADRNTLWVIHFRDRTLKFQSFADHIEAGVGIFRRGTESSLAFELMRQLEQMYLGDSRWDDSAHLYFRTLLQEVRRNAHSNQQSPSEFRHLEAWALRELSSRLRIEDLARHVGLSASYFRQQFRQEMGQSAGQFLQDLRLRQAEILLRQSSLSLKEISSRVGYSEPAAFHRAFIRKFRTTPLHYRKAAPSPI